MQRYRTLYIYIYISKLHAEVLDSSWHYTVVVSMKVAHIGAATAANNTAITAVAANRNAYVRGCTSTKQIKEITKKQNL